MLGVGMALLLIAVVALPFCSKHETPQEYWSGTGQEIIEKARRDEIEAWKRVEAVTGEDKNAAILGAQLATEVRKRFEDARLRNIGATPGP
jgi:hypothetical protein